MKIRKLILLLGTAFLAAAGMMAALSACVSSPVSYYGCPNSKRIEKLNLRKKRMGQ